MTMSQRICGLAVLGVSLLAGGGGLSFAQAADAEGDQMTTPPALSPGMAPEVLFRGLPPVEFRGQDLGHARERARTHPGADLSANDTPIRNQGTRGWCTAFATLGAVENLAKQSGKDLDLSAIHLWSTFGDISDPNTGAVINDVVKAAETHWIVPDSVWPYWGAPTIAKDKLDDAGVARVGSSNVLQTEDQVFTALDAGHPVLIAVTTQDNWQALSWKTDTIERNGQEYTWQHQVPTDGTPAADGFVRLTTPLSPYAHAIALVGYVNSDQYPGGGYFIVKNSWGTFFGNKGYYYIPFGYCGYKDSVGKVNQCYFIEVASALTRDPSN